MTITNHEPVGKVRESLNFGLFLRWRMGNERIIGDSMTVGNKE